MVNGKELANAYSELNDPIDQEQRFVDQMQLADKGATRLWLSTMTSYAHYSMVCRQHRVLELVLTAWLMLMTANEYIQEVMPFPQLKPEAKMPQSSVKEWAALGVPENWVYVLRKAGFNLISDIKDQKCTGSAAEKLAK